MPIKGVAKELELPVHDVDTFTGWTVRCIGFLSVQL